MTEDDFTAQLEAGFEKGMEAGMARLEGAITKLDTSMLTSVKPQRTTPMSELEAALQAIEAAAHLASDVAAIMCGELPAETEGKLDQRDTGSGIFGDIASMAARFAGAASSIQTNMDRIRKLT